MHQHFEKILEKSFSDNVENNALLLQVSFTKLINSNIDIARCNEHRPSPQNYIERLTNDMNRISTHEGIVNKFFSVNDNNKIVKYYGTSIVPVAIEASNDDYIGTSTNVGSYNNDSQSIEHIGNDIIDKTNELNSQIAESILTDVESNTGSKSENKAKSELIELLINYIGRNDIKYSKLNKLSKAVVFLYNNSADSNISNFSNDEVLKLCCIGGWARYNAYKNFIKNNKSNSEYNNDIIEIYILDSTNLSIDEKIFISMYINAMDEVDDDLIVSRPYNFSDILYTLYYKFNSIIVSHAALESDQNVGISKIFFESLFDTKNYCLLLIYLTERMSINIDETLSTNTSFKALILRLIIILYGLDDRQCNYQDEAFQLDKFLPLQNSSYAEAYFAILYDVIPFEIQYSISIKTLLNSVSFLNCFFIVRASTFLKQFEINNDYKQNNVSLVEHFLNKREPARKFLTKLANFDKLKTYTVDNSSWTFDALASFASFYLIHFFIETSTYSGDDFLAEQVAANNNPSDTKFLPLSSVNQKLLFLLHIGIIYGLFIHRNLVYYQSFVGLLKNQPTLKINFTRSFYTTLVAQQDNINFYKDSFDRQSIFEIFLGLIAELMFNFTFTKISADINYISLKKDIYQIYSPNNRFATNGGIKKSIKKYLLSFAIYLNYLLHKENQDLVLILSHSFTENKYIKILLPNLVATRFKIFDYVIDAKPNSIEGTYIQSYKFIFHYLTYIMSMPEAAVKEFVIEFINGVELNFLFESICSKYKINLGNLPQILNPINNEKDSSYLPDDLSSSFGLIKDDINTSFIEKNKLYAKIEHNREAQIRITHWFDERRVQAKLLITCLYQIYKQKLPGVELCADFRKKTARDAKKMVTYLTDLAEESNNIEYSIQDIPYQLQVTDPSILPFAKKAVEAIKEELDSTMMNHLEEGLRILIESADSNNIVIISSRPSIIAVLWQTLTHINPFYDLMHPLACEWNELRSKFAAWLWEQIKNDYCNYWKNICAKHYSDTAKLPEIKFCIRRLQTKLDHSYMKSIIDLTAERLESLLKGPGLLNRVSSAFYRFQCSGMTNANAALSINKNKKITVADFVEIFNSSEASISDMFNTLWTTMSNTSIAEDALHDNEIAAACFLKRYAPYILNGLETQDIINKAQMKVEEEIEERAKRRRKEGIEDIGIIKKITNQRKSDDLPAVLILTYNMIAEMKKGYKNMYSSAYDDNDDNWKDFFATLPYTDAIKLNYPLPSTPCIDQIQNCFTQAILSMRKENSSIPLNLSINNDRLNGNIPNLPKWLNETPVLNLWRNILMDYKSNCWHCKPDANSLNEQNTVSSKKPPICEDDILIVQSVLSYLKSNGFSSIYNETTKSLFPIETFFLPDSNSNTSNNSNDSSSCINERNDMKEDAQNDNNYMLDNNPETLLINTLTKYNKGIIEILAGNYIAFEKCELRTNLKSKIAEMCDSIS